MKTKEWYTVKFNYQKDDGYWVIGASEIVELEVDVETEKNNHEVAANVIRDKYKMNNVEVKRVKYW